MGLGCHLNIFHIRDYFQEVFCENFCLNDSGVKIHCTVCCDIGKQIGASCVAKLKLIVAVNEKSRTERHAMFNTEISQ